MSAQPLLDERNVETEPCGSNEVISLVDVDITDDQLRNMPFKKFIVVLADLPEVEYNLLKTRYSQVRAQQYGEVVLAHAQEVEEKCPINCAEQMLDHLDEYRAGYAINHEQSTETALEEQHNVTVFIKTFNVNNEMHLLIHEAFLEKLRERYQNEARFKELRPTGELAQDIDVFTKDKVVAVFDDIAIVRYGLLDADDNPHSLNYRAVRFGEHEQPVIVG